MPSLSLSDGLLLLLYAVVLFLPGLLVALAAGLSRWTAFAAAVLISYGITATAGPLTAALGLTWTPVSALVATAVLAGLCFVLRTLWRRRAAAARGEPVTETAADRSGTLVVAAGVAVAAVVGAVVVLAAIGTLGAINQDWDAAFHANTVRFIIASGNADPGALSLLNDSENPDFFYPNAYHALAAIVGQLASVEIPVLLNAQTVFLPGIAGLGLAALIRAHGGRVALAAVVPLLLVSFSGFPYDLLWRGPLLPYATGVALIPGFMVLLTETVTSRRPGAMVVSAVAAVGLLGLHPSAALSGAIFAIPLMVIRWLSRPAAVAKEAATLLVVAVIAAVVGLRFALGALSVGGTADIQDWKANQSPGQAVGDLFLLNHGRVGPQFWLVALLLVGVFTLSRIRGLWWWLAGTAVFVGGFVAASAYDELWAETITGPWWNDRWRFVALVVLGLAVVAGNGAVVLADAVVRLGHRIPRGRALSPRVFVGAAMVVVLALFGAASGGFYVSANAERMSMLYGAGPTVTPGEEDAMAELASLVGPGERVMNDPGDGSPWMYALEDVVPVFGHVIAPRAYSDIGPDQTLLLSSFRCMDSNPDVREVIEKYDITYAYVGTGYVRSTFTRVPGLLLLSQVQSLDLAYVGQGTAIYRVALTDELLPDKAKRCGTATA
ncbi:MAG: hypothetical protein H0U09_03130 [Geodermatophilaceae bacterium]|nr:hypothetical protein [Geodermatophilaceae bacterium]